MRFAVNEEVRADVRIVSISGEFDFGDAPTARRVLQRAASDRDRSLVVDLTACELIDSAGIATIVGACRPLQNGQAKVAIACPPGSRADESLRLSGVDLSIAIVATVEEAVRVALTTE